MVSAIQSFVDVQKIGMLVVGYLPNFISAVLLFFVFWFANKIMQKTLETTLTRLKIERQAINLLLRGAKTGLYIFAVLTIADQLQLNIKSLLAGVGVMGLALSFAAKDTVENIICGIVIIIDRPFKEGDWILLGSMHATVTQIRLRTTVLTTFDNETVVVPNQQISRERITNFTMTPRIRVKVPVGIAYKEDIDQARAVMLALPENDDRIMTRPAPIVIVKNLGDSSVNLELRFWVENPAEQFGFLWEYTEKVKKALDAANIQIPFPHLQLFVEDADGVRLLASPPQNKPTSA